MELRLPKLCWALAVSGLLAWQGASAQNAFYDSLPIPELVDNATVDLTMDVEYHYFTTIPGDSLNVPIKTFAFNSPQAPGTNTCLGPTLVWRQGRHQTTNITNNLPSEYPSTVHWHGAHIPAWTDGGPHQVINPGTTFSPDFNILDSTCTLWYHPHGLDETYVQVQMGLAGVIYVKDPQDNVDPLLPNRYGIDDFPLIIQDVYFQRSTTQTDSFSIDTSKVGRGRRIIMNGVVQPYLDVPPQPVRFHILNGSTRLPYTLSIGPNTLTHLSFKLTGSDGGHLPDSARTITSINTAPGTRNEIVFDFTAYAGQTLYMTTSSFESPGDTLVMKFVVGAVPALPVGTVPAIFEGDGGYPYDGNTKVRDIRLLGNSSGGGPGNPGNVPFSINSRQFVETTIDDTVNLDDIEIWDIRNQSNRAHPFHIHDIQFYVIDVRVDSNNAPLPIPVEYLGRKDDIFVQPGQAVRFVTKFDDFGTPKPFNVDTDTYMYHCHILTHEDGMYAPADFHNGMMQQFVVWDGTVTGVDVQDLTDEMSLYPNPAHDRIHLRGVSTKASEVKVYDLQGRLLRSQQFAPFSGEVTIAVDGIAAGMVLVEWRSPQGKFTKKVVID